MKDQSYITWNFGLKAKLPVSIVSLEQKTTKYAGGGNPFEVDSIDVEFEFIDSAPRHTSQRQKLVGYLQPNGAIGFFGNCADSGLNKFLFLSEEDSAAFLKQNEAA